MRYRPLLAASDNTYYVNSSMWWLKSTNPGLAEPAAYPIRIESRLLPDWYPRCLVHSHETSWSGPRARLSGHAPRLSAGFQCVERPAYRLAKVRSLGPGERAQRAGRG